MSRATKTPEQHEATYRWYTPSEVTEMIGVDGADTVRALIRGGHLEAIDVSRSKRSQYRISPESVDAYLGTQAASEEAERMRRLEMSKGSVYVAEAVGVGRVKIGFSTEIERRLTSLRTACPVPVRLLYSWEADQKFERRLHDALADYRTHGEWFEAAAVGIARGLMEEWCP